MKENIDKVAIQLEAISDSLEKLEKKPAKDHSQELESIRSEISRFKGLLSEIRIDVPKTDLTPLNAKLEAINERLTTIDERTKYIRWLFPDVRAFFTSIGTWLFVGGIGCIVVLSFVSWYYFGKSKEYKEGRYKYEFYNYSKYSMPQIDSLYGLYPDRIISIVDSTLEARAKRAEIEAERKRLEEEEKKLKGE